MKNFKRNVILVLFALGVLTLEGACQSSHQAILSWGASPTQGVSYNVKRSLVSGGPYSLIKGSINLLTYTDAGLQSNTKYCYVVSASDPANNNQESPNTSETCGVTNKDTGTPGTLSIIIQ